MPGIQYPNDTASTVSYSYGTSGGLNDVISRLDALKQGTLTVESYKYLGLSTVVLRQEADGVSLTYIGTSTGDAGDKYTRLDLLWQAGQVALGRWRDEHRRPGRWLCLHLRCRRKPHLHPSRLTGYQSLADTYTTSYGKGAEAPPD